MTMAPKKDSSREAEGEEGRKHKSNVSTKNKRGEKNGDSEQRTGLIMSEVTLLSFPRGASGSD